MRKALVSSLALVCCLLFSGCAFFPDFQTSPVYHAPVSEVVNQIRCEMSEFIKWQKENQKDPNFSLDEHSYSTIELALSTTAYGEAKFSKIDTTRLGATGFLAIGSASGQPFPTAGVKQLNQTIAKITINVSQNPDLLKNSCEYGYAEIFSDKPYADRILINDLRIGEWLKKSFKSAQRIKSEGAVCNMRPTKGQTSDPCSVSLETATLTTKFELIGDVSGGVLSLGKLIPVIATPTLEFNVDYYHQITIIFSGNNGLIAAPPSHPGAAHGKRLLAPPIDPASAAIIRQLRSIRDATILGTQPR